MTTTIATLSLTAFAWLLCNEIQAAIDRRNARRYAMNATRHKLPPQDDDDAISVLALCKGRERYIIMHDAESRTAALRTLGRWASNPELSFTWLDAATLSSKIRNES